MSKKTLAVVAPCLAAQVGDAFVHSRSQVEAPGLTVNGCAEHVQVVAQRPQAQTHTVQAGALCAVGVCAAAALAVRKRTFSIPVKHDRPSVTMFAFESELGVQPPAGFWDPLGFTKDGDAARFRRRREVELKHGRVSMIACMGYIAPEYFKFEGFLSPSLGLKFADVPNGLAALSKVPTSGLAQMVSFAATVELWIFADDPKRAPGDFENAGVLGVPFSRSTVADGDAKKKRLSAEIANGRLAMMAIIGMFYQDGLTGSAWGDWSLYTDSPLRAFENELGVQAPLGYWDPLGLSKDGDAEAFTRRRVTEIKHGRVAMWACMGYITPEYFKWPGYCSPSQKLAFADIPNGLAAFSKLPGAGWLQMFLFAGVLETGFFKYDPSRAPGDYENGGVLGVPNGSSLPSGDAKTRKLNSELANGRLAMMAIIGMFYQDGLTGSAWGDWSLYTDSPLRAFENELGVQAPLGYWDPLGLARDGNVSLFRRRREIELKHGRVSMIACIGYIVPEYFKWPAYISPSLDLRFGDIPNGLAALSKIPSSGLLQMFLFAGMVDYGYFQQDPSRDPGDFKNGGILGVPNGSGPMPDAEARRRRLNAELANGRLAMMAIIGMFFQDGLAGSAWADWDLYTDSPLRAISKAASIITTDAQGQARFVSGSLGEDTASGAQSGAWVGEVGATLPLCDPKEGMTRWDPFQFTAGENADKFEQYRAAELKHGRVAMMAIVGLVTQHFVRFNGLASYDGVVDLTNAPSGFEAISVFPSSSAFGVLVLLAGIAELRMSDEGRAPGDFGDPLGLREQVRYQVEDDKLLKCYELEHGRLAMLGVMGTLAAEYVTHYDAVQQWDHAREGAARLIKYTTVAFPAPPLY